MDKMKTLILAFLLLPSIASADLYNGRFNSENESGFALGWNKKSSHPYSLNFASRVIVYKSLGSGRKRLTIGDYTIRLKRMESYPEYQYIELNKKHLQPVVPNEVYRYNDTVNCSGVMPIIISYFDSIKNLLRSAVFSTQLTIPDYKWHDYTLYHRIPSDASYVSMNRSISPKTAIGSDCYVSEVHNQKTIVK